MLSIKRLFIVLFINFSFSIFGETKQLKTADIQPIFHHLLAYHIENQTCTPSLIKRSFKLIVEQFDPSKNYFMEFEVKQYLEMDDATAEKILQRVLKQDYRDYQEVLKVIQSGIYRAQQIRINQLDVLKKKGFQSESIALYPPYSGYAQNRNHLTDRIEAEVKVWLEMEKKSGQFAQFSFEEKERALQIIEKRVERFENLYLYKDSKGSALSKAGQEHTFCSIVLKSLAKSLDAHTVFFSPEEAMSMRTSLQKQFRGIGVILKESGQGVFIADLVKGGPAAESKLVYKGDLILAVNGVETTGKNFDEILELMQGAEGSALKLTLKRKENEQAKTVDVVLVRKKIIMDDERLSYSCEPFADGVIGKIQFHAFYYNGEGVTTEKDFKEALKALKAQGPLYGLVIDLRQNPGGFLSQAVKVAGLFIPKGVVVIAKYSTGDIQYNRDLDGTLYFQGPVVLMTSKASASAAEVVAQALQDYGAAVVVGDERTYGKGSIQYQNITDESAQAFFKVTIGRYYTVSGKSTQIDGVKADLVVPSFYAAYPIGEKFLQFPISRDDLGFSFLDPNNPLRKLSGADSDHLFSTYFPKQQLKWKNMLPKLKEGSQKRMSQQIEYQAYIQQVTRYKEGKQRQITPWKEDLQLNESLNILKDMILIDQLNYR